jgi:predicted transcriptional regulator
MIRISDDIELPVEAVTETITIVATKNKGKTYAGTKLFEEFYLARAQCVAIDPVGKWWGLRLAADGRSPGLPIPVFGGQHGDMPLRPDAGALMARVLTEKQVSAVLDISEFDEDQTKRFAIDFARELFQQKKRQPSALHVFVDEASRFCPEQKEDNMDVVMLSAFKRIVREGGNHGIGTTLIDQRPQDLSKKVASQSALLLIGQLGGAHERKAIEDWLMARRRKDLADHLEQLDYLEQGEFFCWSPGLLKGFRRTKISPKRTYNVPRPKHGEAAAGDVPTLSAIDVGQLRGALAEMVQEAAGEDPKLLRARIVELERQLAVRPAAAAAPPPPPPPPKIVEVAAISPEVRAELAQLAEDVSKSSLRLAQLGHQVLEASKSAGQVSLPLAVDGAALGAALARAEMERRKESIELPPEKKANAARRDLTGGAIRLLKALATLHPKELNRGQIAKLMGVKATTGTFSNYLSEARARGYVRDRGDAIALTPEGLNRLGKDRPSAPNSTEEMLSLWTPRLSGQAGKILRHLVDHYPGGIKRDGIAKWLGIKADTGTFSNYLSELRANGLAREEERVMYASPDLFPRASMA